VAHDASHDRKARGIGGTAARRIIELLERYGPVFISGEGHLDSEFAERRLTARPELIHEVLAEASVVVGDSQTIATEAALLATPAVRINTWVHSSPHLTELEEQYGLAFSYSPEDHDAALMRLEDLLEDEDTPAQWVRRRERMLEDKVDLTEWYMDLISELAARR
jgi:hypothetical protein